MLVPKTHSKRSFIELLCLIYGVPKVGKTTLMHFQGEYAGKPTLFIATEDGHGAIDTCVVRVTSKTGIEKLLYKFESAKEQLINEYSCIVVDRIDEIDSMVAEWVCETNGITSLSDMEHGRGWNLHLTEFKKIVMRILALGLPVKFITHTRERPFKHNGRQITIQSPDGFTKNSRNFILGKVDSIGYMLSEGLGDVKLSFVPSLSTDAGSRVPNLVGDYKFDVSNPTQIFKDIDKKMGGETTKKDKSKS